MYRVRKAKIIDGMQFRPHENVEYTLKIKMHAITTFFDTTKFGKRFISFKRAIHNTYYMDMD